MQNDDAGREAVARIVYSYDPAKFYDRVDGWCWMSFEQAVTDAPAYAERAREKADAILALQAQTRAEVVEECAAKCLEVSGIIGARAGSSIDSAMNEAATAIRALATPAAEGGGEGG